MKTQFTRTLGLVLGLGLASLPTGRATADEPKAKAEPKFTYAFLYGEAVAAKGGQSAGGFTIQRIDWKLGTADESKLSPLVDNLKVRRPVTPVGRTVVLKKDATKVVLLGPDGKDLELSLKKGPLADAKPSDLQLNTVAFSFSPDGKTLAFVNEAGNDCRITLEKMELTVGKEAGLSRYNGIHFSDDGKRIAYSKHDAGVSTIFSADPDGKNDVKLVAATDVEGFGFLPEGRVGVVTKAGMTTYDAKTGKAVDTVKWAKPLSIRSFGGFCPDGSAFVFDDGGPYHLDLYHVDLKTQKVTAVKKQYLESFQLPAWVKVPAK